MATNVYEVNGRAYRFNPHCFELLFEGATFQPGTTKRARMEAFGERVGVSWSTVKDWLRGAHSPVDILLVDSVAEALSADAMDLLSEIKLERKSNMPTELQVSAFCTVRKKILNVLEVAKDCQFFAWAWYDVRRFPASISSDLVPTGMRDGTWEENKIDQMELFGQLQAAAFRELDYQSPVLGKEVCARLSEIIGRDLDAICLDEKRDWDANPEYFLIDDEGRFKPEISKMATACVKARIALDELTNECYLPMSQAIKTCRA